MMRQRIRLVAAVVLMAGMWNVSRGDPPSPLELARGLREAGMADLALEYLDEIGPKLPPADRPLLLLERGWCLLAAADNEAEEGQREALLGEAKVSFNDFLRLQPKHPRAVEANLALARLTAAEAKGQLSRSRRIDIPPPPAADDPDSVRKERERDAALEKRRQEAQKARPLFLAASKKFEEAAQLLKNQLEDKKLEPALRRRLEREAFEADLAAAINIANLAETVVATGAAGTIERDKFLESARQKFAQLAKGPPNNRGVWIARAWLAEVLMLQGKPNEAEAEFKTILATNLAEAIEGKRLAEFFQVRREYEAAIGKPSSAALEAAANRLRQWLSRYGNPRRPSPEEFAVRYYLAFSLQLRGEILLRPTPKSGKPQTLPPTVQTLFREAERHYRWLGQQQSDYTARAERYRLAVLRRLLGDADLSPHRLQNFEDAQVAAFVQLARLQEREQLLGQRLQQLQSKLEECKQNQRALAAIGLELQRRAAEQQLPRERQRVLALLERARELATPQDPPTEVFDNLLRLTYFYLTNGEPHRAAVLGEAVARYAKAPASRLASAGFLAVNAYIAAAQQVKAPAVSPTPEQQNALAEIRTTDRRRAIALARYLDQRFPNEVATDAIRHRLALLLLEDNLYREAYELILRVRPGYTQIVNARLAQGYLATQLIASTASSKPLSAKEKQQIYRQTTNDLARLVRPIAAAPADQVRDYYLARSRLGQLYLMQSLADPDTEKKTPGYDRAAAEADDILKYLPTYEALTANDKKKGKSLTLDGRELTLMAVDLKTRATFLRAAALLDRQPPDFDAAEKTIQPVIDSLHKDGPLLQGELQRWIGGQGDDGDSEEIAAQKARIAGLAAGIDKVRRDIGLLSFKLAVQQGNPEMARQRLEAVKKLGVTVDNSQDMYERLARELAAVMANHRREKRDAEAKLVGDGLQLLLDELLNAPKKTQRMLIFIGQTLSTIGDHQRAIDILKEIPPPKTDDIPDLPPNTPWWQVAVDTIADNLIRNRFRDESRDYRTAQLYTARSLRELGRYDEAEKLLLSIIGTADKRGFGFASYEFRRELALTYEARAAAAASPKAAQADWRNALNEWTTLFRFAQAEVSRLNPEEATPEQIRRAKSGFFDAYYEVQRVMIAANKHLQKDRPDALQRSLETVGKRIAEMEIANKIAEMEQAGTSIILPETWNRFHQLLESEPAVKKAYIANQGQLFLKPAEQ